MNGEGTGQLQQRIRFGLTGLAFVFLFVLLGTAISRSSEEGGAPASGVNLEYSAEPNEPLAEIGAAPGQSADNQADGQPAQRP